MMVCQKKVTVILSMLVALVVTTQQVFAVSLAFEHRRPQLGFAPHNVRTGDIDGDGVVDLVLGAGFGVGVARGNGDGTFQAPFISPPITWSNGSSGFAEVAVGDVNGDGRADVAVGPSRITIVSEVQVLFGRADGTLGPAMTFTTSPKGNADDIAIADLNGDGNGDLVLALNGGSGGGIQSGTTVSVLLSNGNGTFQAPVEFPSNKAPTTVAVADFNGDGKRDVVVANHPDNCSELDKVSVLLGNGDGTLNAPLATTLGEGGSLSNDSAPFNMAVADLNGDGRQDVAVAHSTGGSFTSNSVADVLFGNGDGTFTKVPRFRSHGLGTQGPLLATGDFNRDGLGDLVVTGVWIHLQKRQPYQFSDTLYDPQNPKHHFLGNGLFGLRELYILATSSTGKIVSADFDRDGWSDVAVIGEEGDARTNVLTIMLNRTGTLPPVSLASLTLDSSTVPGETTVGGTVTLVAPAPAGGVVVELQSTGTFVDFGNMPGTVTVAEGQTSSRFSISTFSDSNRPETTYTIIAQLRDVTKTAPLTVITQGSCCNAPVADDFSLATGISSVTLRRGQSFSTNVAIVTVANFNSPVTLTLSGVPAGISGTPSGPVTVSPDLCGRYAPTTYTFSASSTAKSGTVTITGTGGGLTRTTTFTIKIQK